MAKKYSELHNPLISDAANEGQRTSLLQQDGAPRDEGDVVDSMFSLADEESLSANQLYWNFVLMCAAFSVNHGCVVSCLAYSTAELGTQLGGYGSGVLYVFYALTALLLSKPVISCLGSKTGLILGTSGYCVYVCGFFGAVLFKEGVAAWIMFLLSCAVGGMAGGILWTAQGRYFTKNATLYSAALQREKRTEYARAHNVKSRSGLEGAEAGGSGAAAAGGDGAATPTEEEEEELKAATATFAGFFATSYLGLETMCKISSTAIFLIFSKSAGKTIVFATYASAALLAAVLITRLNHLRDFGSGSLTWEAVKGGAMDAAYLCFSDVRLALLLPYQINFGFVSTYVPFYIFGVIVGKSDTLGGDWVGCLSAIITLTGAMMGLPAAWVSRKLGKAGQPSLMVFGGLCTAAAGAALFCYTNEQIGTWQIIIPLLIIYGIGRGTWENVNKAVVANLYAEKPSLVTSAFAAVSFANGFSGSIAYFAFPNAPRNALGWTVVVTSFVAIFSYLWQVRLSASKNE